MINAKYVDGLELRIRELSKKLSDEADAALQLIAENKSLKAERDALATQVEALQSRISTTERVEEIFSKAPELSFEECKKLFPEEIRELQAEALQSEIVGLVSTVFKTSKALIEATETLERELLPALEDSEPLIELIEEFKSVVASTPQQHLAEIRAAAGRDGFIEGVEWQLYNYNEPTNKIDAADKYADCIRKETK